MWVEVWQEEGEVLDCWANNCWTQGRSVRSVSVFTLFFRGSSLVRVSTEEMEGTGSEGVFESSSRSISPTFSNESPG